MGAKPPQKPPSGPKPEPPPPPPPKKGEKLFVSIENPVGKRMPKKEEQFDTMDKRKILDMVHSHRIKRLRSIIDRQKKYILTMKRYCWLCCLFIALTLLLCFAVDKFPIAEHECGFVDFMWPTKCPGMGE